MDRSRALWGEFEKSGKLTDYLTFCEERRRAGASSALPEEAEQTGKAADQSSL